MNEMNVRIELGERYLAQFLLRNILTKIRSLEGGGVAQNTTGAHRGQKGYKMNRVTSRDTKAEQRKTSAVRLRNWWFRSVRISRSQGRSCSRLHTTARACRNGGQDGEVEVGYGNDVSRCSRVPGRYFARSYQRSAQTASLFLVTAVW
jgi:hypothetical protein